MSPFLSSDFVSCTCTLEVTLHSAAFNVFRLCFKCDAVSKTAPYVCFPHIRISNICSLLVITYTFGQQRQSTDWEGERLERGELLGFFSSFFPENVWMINYLVLQKGSTGFQEQRQKPPNECFLSSFRIIDIWFKGNSELFCLVSRSSTERRRSFLFSFSEVQHPSQSAQGHLPKDRTGSHYWLPFYPQPPTNAHSLSGTQSIKWEHKAVRKNGPLGWSHKYEFKHLNGRFKGFSTCTQVHLGLDACVCINSPPPHVSKGFGPSFLKKLWM